MTAKKRFFLTRDKWGYETYYGFKKAIFQDLGGWNCHEGTTERLLQAISTEDFHKLYKGLKLEIGQIVEIKPFRIETVGEVEGGKEK